MPQKKKQILTFRTLSGKLSCGSQALLMGILNLTPDSFYDGGTLLSATGRPQLKTILAKAAEMIQGGAKILDLGGESTRPGFQPISAEEELQRLLPAVRAIRKEFPRQLLSIDTTKPEVAEACLEEGAEILNDLGGLHNQEMCQLAAKYQPGIILTSITNSPLPELSRLLRQACKATGLPEENFMLDPGIGFGKETTPGAANGNRKALLAIPRIRERLRRPILLAHSRKSYIDQLLQKDSTPQQRFAATLATSLLAVTQLQADALRIHDVTETAEALRITQILTSKHHTPNR